MKQKIIYTVLLVLWYFSSFAQDFVTSSKEPGAIPIVSESGATPIYVEDIDHILVKNAAALLSQDIEAVTGKKPSIHSDLPASGSNVIIIGWFFGSLTFYQTTGKAKEAQYS
jgi:hypothetical protein